MNSLHVGFTKQFTLPKSRFLFIDDEVPTIPHARVFDPTRHSFNPLKDISYKKARELSDVLYTISPQGENTLTVRNGRRSLLQTLLTAKRFDKIDGDEEVNGMVSDILASPILESVLCGTDKVFSFGQNSIVLARINRAELGEFDALVLGLLLIGHFKGQLVIPDFGFYGRDGHVSLVREKRLIAGVHYLEELPLSLRRAILLIPDKYPSGAIAQDAETLAQYSGLIPGTNGYNAFVEEAMSHE